MDHFGEPGFQEWAADARVAEAARRRRRVTAWTQHGCEDASLEGVLADLMDRRCEVLATLSSGRRHRGRVVAVTDTWTVLATSGDRLIGVRLRSILGLDSTERLRSFGDRIPQSPAPNQESPATPVLGEPSSLAATEASTRLIIESFVDPGEQVTMWSGSLMTSGELRSLSTDLAVVASPTGVRYVSLAGVDEVIGSRLT